MNGKLYQHIDIRATVDHFFKYNTKSLHKEAKRVEDVNCKYCVYFIKEIRMNNANKMHAQELQPLKDPICERLGHKWAEMRTIRLCDRCGETQSKPQNA